ncbi:UvrD-helicase domain-containing protein [Xanthomonas hortorum]|uniref:UvrD-helicase domain-containing protein n=1 Tax=Xanthomonas hortorum TaxID=56454 RepID=UPI001F4246DA|nr:ATP-dependent helicase [Xanthomonas hortorum]MCE4364853.1 ATP-dependent helicase [Xanthomonas hortorum]
MIAPGQWHPIGIEVLELGAKTAITLLKGNAVVIANPGSGKTELLAQRADFLFRTGVCRYPKKILAISFKTDASRTLRKRVADRSGFDYAHRIDSQTFHGFARRLIHIYRPLLVGKDRLDPGFKVGADRVGREQVAFKELVPLAQKLIDAHPMVKRSVNMAYSHVFLDEFQDCTDEQYTLISSLFRNASTALTAVGDAKQKIMGWAGALDGVMQMFAKDFGAKKLSLVQNWRSTAAIRRVQNRMIQEMEPASAVDDAELAGDEGQVLLSQFPDEQAEAKRIAKVISAWIAEGVAPHQIAILHIRQSWLFNETIDSELDALGIPRRNEQDLQDLASEPLADFVVDLLQVLGSKPAPNAYVSLLRALSSNNEDEGPEVWVEVLNQARRRVAEGELTKRAKLAFNEACEFIDLVPQGLLMTLSQDNDGVRSKEIKEQILAAISGLIEEHGDVDLALARFRDEGAVRVMTIHKCKGMEFECVVMPCMEQETWWGGRDENRNAFFVGVSRAKKGLAVTHALRRSAPTGMDTKKWSINRKKHAEFLSYVEEGALPL